MGRFLWFLRPRLSNRELLILIVHQQESIMATQAEILAQLASVNASLDNIVEDIAALDALIQAGQDLSIIQAASSALADKAAAIAATHPNP